VLESGYVSVSKKVASVTNPATGQYCVYLEDGLVARNATANISTGSAPGFIRTYAGAAGGMACPGDQDVSVLITNAAATQGMNAHFYIAID
jgi:hypothetical protein